MKRATAFILSIVYLAFAFGSSGYESTVQGVQYAYVATVADLDETGEISTASSEDGGFITTPAFQKVHKHLATVAKVKLPRPGIIHSSSFAAFVPEHHSVTGTHQLRTGTPLWSSPTLYLRNCVFLI